MSTINQPQTAPAAYDTKYADAKILIRPCRSTDLNHLYEALEESRPALERWMTWCHKGYSKSDLSAWVNARQSAWEEGSDYTFVICDRDDQSIYGTISLNNIIKSNKMANLGYWVRSSCTGRGIASSAARLIARFGFEKLNLNRIEILAATDNLGSLRVAAKAGAVKEGVLRRRIEYNDQVYDAAVYSFICEEILGT